MEVATLELCKYSHQRGRIHSIPILHVEVATLELCKYSHQRGRIHSIPMLEMGSEKAFVDLLNILKFEYDLIGYIDGILSLDHNFQF